MRTLTIVVVNELDQVHDAINKFLRVKRSKKKEHILFIYNIGPVEFEAEDFLPIFRAPFVLCVFNCDADLVTKKAYGKDYLTANADATVVAQQMVGVECDLPTYYNFFAEPKRSLYDSYMQASDNGQPRSDV